MRLAGMPVCLIGMLFRGRVIALLMVLGSCPMGLGSALMMLGGFVVLGFGHDQPSLTYDVLRTCMKCNHGALSFIVCADLERFRLGRIRSSLKSRAGSSACNRTSDVKKADPALGYLMCGDRRMCDFAPFRCPAGAG